MAITRLYRPGDRDALRVLVLELHETVRTFDDDLLPGHEIEGDYFQDLLARVEETDGAIYVAEVDQRIVGHVVMFGPVEPVDRDERTEAYAFMAELFVDPSHRGGGIGRDLVARAESYARRQGAYKLELKVRARNESGVRFYEGVGYEARIVLMSKRL